MHFIIIKNVKESRRASLARMTRNQEAHSFIFPRRKLHRRALFPPNFYCLGIYNISPSNLIAARTKSERETKNTARWKLFSITGQVTVVGAQTHIRNEIGPAAAQHTMQFPGQSARSRRVLLSTPEVGAGQIALGVWMLAERGMCSDDLGNHAQGTLSEGKGSTYRLPTSSGCTGVRGQVPPLCSPLSASNEGCTGALIVFQPRSISYNAAKNAETRCWFIASGDAQRAIYCCRQASSNCVCVCIVHARMLRAADQPY